MTQLYSEDEVMAANPRLTRTLLIGFIEAEVLTPMQAGAGRCFSSADLARLDLLCDLAEHFELEGNGLGIVMSLLDQLHDARAMVQVLAEALAEEPAEVRARVGARLLAAQR
ncbi:hypothetical protein RNZ50_17720 [Paracoccaceae bacterium Fryx2]|nr:hypothetical protein [Paracoccaceae bacterium Fryx2]